MSDSRSAYRKPECVSSAPADCGAVVSGQGRWAGDASDAFGDEGLVASAGVVVGVFAEDEANDLGHQHPVAGQAVEHEEQVARIQARIDGAAGLLGGDGIEFCW